MRREEVTLTLEELAAALYYGSEPGQWPMPDRPDVTSEDLWLHCRAMAEVVFYDWPRERWNELRAALADARLTMLADYHGEALAARNRPSVIRRQIRDIDRLLGNPPTEFPGEPSE